MKPTIFMVSLPIILCLTGCDSSGESARLESARLSADCMDRGMQAFERYKAGIAERYVPGGFLDPPEFHFKALPAI
jgi:hypothetical protein